MLGSELRSPLRGIGRQRTVRVDAGQWPAAQMCHHVVDCSYLLLHSGCRAGALRQPRPFLVHLLHHSAVQRAPKQYILVSFGTPAIFLARDWLVEPL